jgi:hypothetical protein
LLLSLIGSAACFFGVRKEEKRKIAWLRWASRSNYFAALVGVVMLFTV